MSAKLINVRELQEAIATLETVFLTRDVSQQPALKAAHRLLAGHTHWASFVGRAISEHQGELGVKSVGRSRGSEQWSKLASAPPLPPATPGRVGASSSSVVRAASDDRAREGSLDLGPQYAGDAPFTARMRRHQSWWRASVLRAACGYGPTASSESRYGNMLEPLAAEAGMNFLSAEIFAIAKARLDQGRGTIERFRLLHNLLSSQPMCFNLVGPLVRNLDLATRLVRGLVGGDVARVRAVAIEWAPEPAADYLADRTAFDAMIDYERRDGGRVLIGIETKLTDSFSQKPYDRDEYRRWMRAPSSPFRSDAAEELVRPRHNQLWRNHLLAIAARDRTGSPYAAARSALIIHPLDKDGAEVVASYRTLLKPDDDTFMTWTLDKVADIFTNATTAAEKPWLDAFRKRYLALEESERLVSRA